MQLEVNTGFVLFVCEALREALHSFFGGVVRQICEGLYQSGIASNCLNI
jgi:hypothetical protein